MIYLDNSATTRVKPEVSEYIYRLMQEEFGNASSLYDLGINAEKLLITGRKTIAKALKATADEIYFTASGSESNNLAIKGMAETYKKRGNHIIATAVEHPSVLESLKYLESHGYRITLLPVDSRGNLNLADLEAALTKDTILVTMMMVNNEIGTIFPLAEAGKLIKSKFPDCHFHVDGVQGFGRLPVDVGKMSIDTFSLSGHKIGAPKGVGALYVKKGLRLQPLIHGGGQEKGLRAGTENIYYIAGLALAANLALADRAIKNQKLQEVKAELLSNLRAASVDFIVNGGLDAENVPYILNLGFPGVTSEVLLHFLEGQQIYVSQGSACHSKTKGSSETLAAMGQDDETRNTALRFSFSDDTKIEDMAAVAKAVKAGTDMIKEMRRGK